MRLLAVIDFQHDFVSGNLGFPGAEKLDEPIAEKIREYINSGNLVLRTMDTHGNDYMNTREGKHLPVPHCIYGTQGWEAYGETGKAFKELEKNPRYYSISKTSFAMSPYYVGDWLEWLFRNDIDFSDIDTIEFVGLVSNICVISNMCVLQGALPNAQIIVDPKLIASHDPKAHEAVLEVMKSLQVEFIGEEN